ncbi:outer membrane beta-barrel protein [Mangrovimonas aestuarii]|uniref:outer membrane beta-barrel protein n=1 Tax=Mangrovimonas aestuarii TaxID=3018443 RepID=UPI00237960B7|nr:outer membrane beta-barrel protein [Mangrovimonas aestuarii]
MQRLLLAMALLWPVITFSQSQEFKISGTLIAQEDKTPLESATVHVARIQDSTVVTYSISDKDGNFLLEDTSYDKSIDLYVSYMGYTGFHKRVVLDKYDINLGTIAMEESSNELQEIVITSQAPVTIKKDTLEFNVKSFKTKKDATVEDLLKQLPGVEVDENGKIKVNGKEVNKILVNGKPFFGDDPTITTRNLTKEIIDKIQVVDTKSKSEAFSGEVTDSDNKTINLTIKEENNKGVFGRVAAGGGTDDRYEFAGMFNYFNNDRRVSVLAGGNNINSPGFSFGEIQKMFGGYASSFSSDGSFTIDGRTFGGGQGITKSQNAGMNYADNLSEGVEVTADYFYAGSNSENTTVTKRENILPDTRYFTNSRSNSISDNDSHSSNIGFDIEIDSTFLINVDPSFRHSNSKTSFSRDESTSNIDEVLTNESETSSYVENIAKSFSNNIDITKKFGSKGAYLKAYFSNNISTRETDDYLFALTNVYGEDLDDPNNTDFVLIDQDERDQYTEGMNEVNEYSSSISYRLPLIPKELFLGFSYGYINTKTTDTKTTLDKNENGDYTEFNALLSSDFEYTNERLYPGMSLSFKNKKWSTRFNAEYIVRNLENKDRLRPELSMARQFNMVNYRLFGRYKFSSKSTAYASYRLNNDVPELAQIQPFVNVSNPLNIVVGNPDLEPSTNHNVYMGYNNYDFQSQSGFYVYVNGGFIDDQIVSRSRVDENLVRQTTYDNVDGNYRFSGGANFSKKVKLDSIRSVKYTFGAYGNINKSVNFNNDVLYASKTRNISPEVGLEFLWKDVLEVSPRYSPTFTKSIYDLEVFDDTSFLYHNLNLRTAWFLPKGLEWRNDIQYSYNPNISQGFQKSAWFWNATVAYSILKDQGLITFKVYDLLDQNTNARRIANQDYIQDSQSTVLQQYFMLSLSWKFNSLGKKGEINDRGRYFH